MPADGAIKRRLNLLNLSEMVQNPSAEDLGLWRWALAADLADGRGGETETWTRPPQPTFFCSRAFVSTGAACSGVTKAMFLF
jgi:hypothetical protein